jgi:hypothetical protein
MFPSSSDFVFFGVSWMQGVCQSTPGRVGRSKSPAFGLAILVAKIQGGQLAGFRRDVRV